MINLKLSMFNYFNKIKQYVLNVTLILIVFISLSATVHSENDKDTLNELKEIVIERDSLQNIICNELVDLKSRENDIIRKTLSISKDGETPITLMTLNGINEYIEEQKIAYVELNYEVNKQWDSISNIPVICPISSSDLKCVSDDYGFRLHPINNKIIFHEGVDLSAKIKSDVFSTSNGTVSLVRHSNKGYGNRIVIDHGNGYKTVYAHLNDISVKVGQEVLLGETIGHVGNTGLSTGPHLHYEVLVNNKHVNPSDYYILGSKDVYDYLAVVE